MLSSRGEIKIHKILEMNGINFKEEYTMPGLCADNGKPLRFDFAVFDDNDELVALIEYQGAQHYQPVSKFGGKRGFYQQQYNDNKKRRYCAFNHINLIEIPYTDEQLINYDYLVERMDLF